MDILIVVNRMAILLILMILGFFLSKLGITSGEFTRSGTKVLMNVLIPAVILNSALRTTATLKVAELLVLMLIPGVMMGICTLVSYIFPKLIRTSREQYGMSAFMIMCMNISFIGLPVIESLYGADGVFYTSLSNFMYSLFSFTVGIMQVNHGDNVKPDFKKVINPVIVSTLIGAVFMVTGLRLPTVLDNTISYLASATIAVSMLVVGTSLAAVKFKASLTNWRIYAISIARLIICPVIVWFVLGLFVQDKIMLGTLTIIAATPTAMLATAFAIQFKKDEGFASGTVFISTALSALSLPFIVWLLL